MLSSCVLKNGLNILAIVKKSECDCIQGYFMQEIFYFFGNYHNHSMDKMTTVLDKCYLKNDFEID